MKLLNINIYFLLVLTISLFLLFNYLFVFSLFNENSYMASYSDQLSTSQIEKILFNQHQYLWVSFIFLFISSLIKFFLISTVLYMGLIIAGQKISFMKIFRVVLISEYIFLIAIFLKFIYFYFIQVIYSLTNVNTFYPLSILNLLDSDLIDKIWIYPLQILNVFEITYWIILAYSISKLINNNFDKAFKIVLSSYLPSLIVWVVFIMFLTVTLNPA